jgi:hypothetical protein
MNTIALTGLDAQNPLAFLAALGLLRVLDDDALGRGVVRPRLAFVDDGAPRAHVSSDLSFDEVVATVLADAEAQATSLILSLAYLDDGTRVAASYPDAARDLKPPPVVARQALSEAATADRRTADLAAGFFSELVQDNNGNTKPTGFHFTAGQQSFLRMVDQLREGLTAADVREALLGPWTNTSTLPSLSWDASATRAYALRASNPSGEKRGSVPAANWLGVMALSALPVSVSRGRLRTTAIKGGWKDSEFTWPLWNSPASFPTIAALLRLDARRWSARERVAMGIALVLSSRIARSDQGGYGSFSPAEVVVPRS